MNLNMTMQQESPGINNMIPDRRPTQARDSRKRMKSIPILGRLQIKVTRNSLYRFRDRAPTKSTIPLTDNEMLIRMLVDRMRGLEDGIRLKNQVDPGIILRSDDQVAGNRVLVEEQWLCFLELEAVAGITESPAVGDADLVDVQEEGLCDIV